MNATEIEYALANRPFADSHLAGQGWIMPDYGGLSIANLPATIAALLGVSLPGALPPLHEELWAGWRPGLKRVVLVVLDALGWRALRQVQAANDGPAFARLAAGPSARLVPLTSVFPSTTSAALVSLRTGHAPASHGWLAYELYLRELGMAVNAIRLAPVWAFGEGGDQLQHWGWDIDKAIAQPSLAEMLAAAGVTTRGLLHIGLNDTGFTKMLYRGVEQRWTHYIASDFWVQLRRLLADTRGRRTFITAYWAGLDTVGHGYGHDTNAWEAEFRSLDYLLGREFLAPLPAEDRDGTLLLITADHGQIHTPAEQILTANEDRELQEHLLVPVMGESRAAFLYPRAGRTQAVRDYLGGAFREWFVVADSPALIDAGLMGSPVMPETWSRAGDLLVLPLGNHGLQRARPRLPLESRHGGLTPEEMLVPLLGTRLEDVP